MPITIIFQSGSLKNLTSDFADLLELFILALKGHNSQSVRTARQ